MIKTEESVLQTFMALVENMRNAQTRYFAGRAPSDLKMAKKLERDVDNFIRGLKNPVQPKQGSLI